VKTATSTIAKGSGAKAGGRKGWLGPPEWSKKRKGSVEGNGPSQTVDCAAIETQTKEKNKGEEGVNI